MTALEIVLIIVGIVLMIGSFFVTEKLSASELNQISELSTDEMNKILEKEMTHATEKVNAVIDQAIGASVQKVDRAMEKETNEKIMAISEYSETVLEQINKAHNEIMFLYSMLNDKHADLTKLAGELQVLSSDMKTYEEEIEKKFSDPASESATQMQTQKEEVLEEAAEESVTENEEDAENLAQINYNNSILNLHNQGIPNVDIAKELGIGLGEVMLVLELFKGEDESEA